MSGSRVVVAGSDGVEVFLALKNTVQPIPQYFLKVSELFFLGKNLYFRDTSKTDYVFRDTANHVTEVQHRITIYENRVTQDYTSGI